MQCYDVYGVVLASDDGFVNPLPVADARTSPDVVFRSTAEDPPEADWRGAAVFAQGRRADGLPEFVFARFAGHDAVRIADVMEFHVFDDRIVCYLRDEAHRFLVEIALLGMVFAVWLERRGTPTLHAAVATVDGVAVGFLGNKGGGKTSTLAACLARGHALLVDDLLAVGRAEEGFRAERGFPSLRLWPEQAARFLAGWERLPLVRPDTTKVRATVGQDLGRFAAGSAPLRLLYLPERSQDETAVWSERLPPDLAVMALLRHSALAEEAQRFGWQPGRLAVLSELTGHVAVLRLHYPTGFEHLPGVVEHIESHVRDGVTASTPPPR